MQKFLLFCLLLVNMNTSHAVQESKRVAILISSYAEEGRENLSYDLEELAQAYLVLHDNNILVDIISPKGGAVLVKKNKDELDYIQRFKTKTRALKQLSSTIPSAKADIAHYDAVMVIGGSGAMFDLPDDPGSQKLLTHFATNNKPVAAVCHGPAALVNLKNTDGSFLIKGRKVNAFTNIEEQAFGGDVIKLLPFMLEDKLKQHGADFVSNSPMLPFVSVDNNLITAQNPGAVARAAEALVAKLGHKIKPRKLFKDEATMALISQARSVGAYLIDIELNANPEKYDLNYLALYGFYSYGLAQGKQDKLLELSIMQSIAEYFSHPMYLFGLIKAELEQGFNKEAQMNFKKLKASYPEHQAVKQAEGLFNR